MDSDRRAALLSVYRDGLLLDTLPFWTENAPDDRHGGFYTALARDGSVADTDKSVWHQGRFGWLYGTLYSGVEPRDEWLRLSRSAVDFLEKFCFDEDGRMFFIVTEDGRPLRKRRYAYSEAFACMAYAAYGRSANSDEHKRKAVDLFHQFRRLVTTEGLLPPKVIPETRRMKGLGPLMITINLAQVLRTSCQFQDADAIIDECIAEIRRDFIKPELRAVMESVAPDGSILDHFDGRTLNPGHAIEAAWFILHEAMIRNGEQHLHTGLQMLDWMWERGWDREFGGLLYFVDLHGGEVQEYWHDMKFWWPHNEAIIAALLAHRLTGDARYEEMHSQVHDWAYAHFPDPEHGDWFGYLHRDGTVSSTLKGNMWKGAFHLGRMQLYCWKLLEAW